MHSRLVLVRFMRPKSLAAELPVAFTLAMVAEPLRCSSVLVTGQIPQTSSQSAGPQASFTAEASQAGWAAALIHPTHSLHHPWTPVPRVQSTFTGS